MKRFCSGSALLLVLWALFLLTAAVVAYASLVLADLERAGRANRELEAKAMAHSGLVIVTASFQDLTAKIRTFEEEVAPGLGFRARVEGEGARLPINLLVPKTQGNIRKNILAAWLEQHGLPQLERERLIDCMRDWIDEDDLKEFNGQEAEGTYQPANKKFETVEEIARVFGADLLLRSPGWREQLTIFETPIDLSSATEEVLSVLPSANPQGIANFLKLRRGRDGVDGTIDDHVFKTVEEAFQSLSLTLSTPDKAELKGLVSVKLEGQLVRITSEGHSGDIVRQLEVVTRKGAAKPPILFWKE